MLLFGGNYVCRHRKQLYSYEFGGSQLSEQFLFSVKKTDTLRNQVYKDIKGAVIQGKLRPGQRLREADLSDEMGVSRGPIREAILLLEREGLLVTQTHRETTVSVVEKDEVEMLLNPLRILLESYCIRKILPSLMESHFTDLSNIVDELIEGCENNDLDQVVIKDLQFHEYLVNLLNEPYLLNLWSGISSRIVFHFISNSRVHQENNFSKLIEEHKTLLEILKTKDWPRIEAELEKHIY
jgi:DNA-binding GntR family transcriptional regulator